MCCAVHCIKSEKKETTALDGKNLQYWPAKSNPLSLSITNTSLRSKTKKERFDTKKH